MGVKAAPAAYRPAGKDAPVDDSVPPGYKRTEVGVIPMDWRITSIADAAERVTVGFVGSMSHLFRESGLPLLRGQNVMAGKLDLCDLRFISIETHRQWSKSALRAGDVVLVRVGYPGTACEIPVGLGEANAASLVVVRPDSKDLSARFLTYVVNSEFGRRQIHGYLVGGAQQVLNIGTASKFQLPLPSRKEQQAIAEALSDVDALIESLQQLIAKKRALKQGVMQALLTGRQRLPGFSGAWQQARLEEISEFRAGIYLAQDQYCGGKYEVHGAGGVMGYHNMPNFSGAVSVIGRVGTVGRPRFVKSGCWVNNNAGAIVARESVGAPGFVHLILLSVDWGKATSVTAQPFLVVPALLETVVSVPTLAEQTAIATALSDMDTEIDALEDRLAKTRDLKAGMMQALLTGRIRLPLDRTA